MMKSKTNKNKLVGIISYNVYSNHMNYGAALHSYAFQQYLKARGVESIIIGYIPKYLDDYNLKYPIFNFRRVKSVRSFIAHIVNWGLGYFSNLRKYKKFQDFFSTQTRKTERLYRYSELMKLGNIENLEFTDFVSESDIIWKMLKDDFFDECFFLQFPAASGLNKVAYSPTLASREFSESEKVRFMSLVSEYSAISTRESHGAEYLTKLLHRKIDWVLDPTLLLDREDYEKLAVKPEESNYVLLYNCMVDDRKMVREARKFASEKSKKLIEISNFYINKLLFNHSIKTDIGIEEFLGYVANADCVICNAFHGLCLSVIFQKDIYLFLRNRKDYRMQSVTSALGLSSRLIDLDQKMIPENLPPIDYDQVYLRLEEHRKRSSSFIEENIVLR